MPPSSDAPSADAALTADERLRADRAAQRLHAETRALLATLDPTHRNASGLARALDLDRTSCQRLVSAVRGPYPGPELIESLPGARALRAILQEIRDRDLAPADSLQAADVAVERFDRMIASLGGSRAKLLSRLKADSATQASAPNVPPNDHADDEAARRQTLFESAAMLTGRWSESWVAVYIYRSAENDPDRLLTHRVFGLLGHHAVPGAVPLVIHNFSSGDPAADGAPRPGVFNPNDPAGGPAVLEKFTSKPIPLVSTTEPGEFMVQSIDLDEDKPDTSIDLMLAASSEMPHPRVTPQETEELWALVNFPARRLVLDAWLPREESRASIPSLATHLWGPDFATDASRRWQTRFATAPPLHLLGSGLASVATRANPRHAELTNELFRSAGLDPDDFVGVRCEVEYPIWRTGYCITFDFAAPD